MVILSAAHPRKLAEDRNVAGWESIATGWRNVQWPRRPSWEREFLNVQSLLHKARGKDALVFGATPEFRSWLALAGAKVTLYEKSAISLAAMTDILLKDLRLPASALQNESVLAEDWEFPIGMQNKFHLAMGDIVLGYMETPERLAAFLSKIHEMLTPGGVFLLREFFKNPFLGAHADLPVDARRWAYILTPDFASFGTVFSEEMLARHLRQVGDGEVLATCANPPRTRLLLELDGFIRIAETAGFRTDVRVPQADYPSPALLVLNRQ